MDEALKRANARIEELRLTSHPSHGLVPASPYESRAGYPQRALPYPAGLGATRLLDRADRFSARRHRRRRGRSAADCLTESIRCSAIMPVWRTPPGSNLLGTAMRLRRCGTRTKNNIKINTTRTAPTRIRTTTKTTAISAVTIPRRETS
jgi:hypothetical protein